MSEGRAALGRQSDLSPQPERTRTAALLPSLANMCLSPPHPHAHALTSPPAVRDDDDDKTFTATLEAMARRPSWTLRGVFKQPAGTSRPGLPRRFHSKINLNEYWGALEKVVKVEVSWPLPAPANRQRTHGDGGVVDAAMDVDNEVNENLANERAEQSQMDVDGAVAEVKKTPPSPSTVVRAGPAPPRAKRGAKGRRRSTPPHPHPHPRATPPSPCGAPAAASPSRRAPLGTLNGLSSRGHVTKSLSPLSAFADNLARRLARQH